MGADATTASPGLDAARIHAVAAPLCELPGPSGHERLVREHLLQTWGAHGLEPVADPVGNLLARVGGSGPRVLFQAHMDEIGFVVRHITPEGFLFLDGAQGGRRETHERRYMVGQPAQVLGREGVVARGVFAAPAGHVLTQEQMDRAALTLADFFLDIGVESRAEAEEAGVFVGAPVVWDVPTRLRGNRIVGKALDDRLLLAVLTLLLERLDRAQLTCELWLGATVQEENFLHGAKAMAARERFDAVVALDIGLAGDIPVMSTSEVDSHLGAGPVIVHQDTHVVYDQDLCWALSDVAQAAGIPLQHGVFGNYTTDGVAFLDAGMPAVVLAPPVRYTHTAIETADVRDVAGTVALLEAFATSSR